ncbi:MAG: hypothetical protein PHW04_13840, partial [Candidatus Wallbacteria bacterium]|nr:hypothetical protein [Candidatus Wallbacteria bacterium]
MKLTIFIFFLLIVSCHAADSMLDKQGKILINSGFNGKLVQPEKFKPDPMFIGGTDTGLSGLITIPTARIPEHHGFRIGVTYDSWARLEDPAISTSLGTPETADIDQILSSFTWKFHRFMEISGAQVYEQDKYSCSTWVSSINSTAKANLFDYKASYPLNRRYQSFIGLQAGTTRNNDSDFDSDRLA